MPIHNAIRQHLRRRLSNAPRSGVRLESEWALARRFEVSRQVARRELQRLVREGRAEVRRGSGYVSRPIAQPYTGPLRVVIVHPKPDRVSRASQSVILDKLEAALGRCDVRSNRLAFDDASPSLRSGGHNADAYLLHSVTIGTQSVFAAQAKPVVVLGNTYRDLGMPSVCLNELEVATRITKAMLETGHQRLALVQTHRYNLGLERSRMGFEFAHHAHQCRLPQDRIVRIPVTQRGFRSSLSALLRTEPTGLLVQSAEVWATLLRTATAAQRELLERMDVVLLGEDLAGELDAPLPQVAFDVDVVVNHLMNMLDACLSGRGIDPRYVEARWHIKTSKHRPNPPWTSAIRRNAPRPVTGARMTKESVKA